MPAGRLDPWPITPRRRRRRLRRSIGGAIFERIAGPDGAEVARAAARGRTPSAGSSRAARSPASTATRRCSSAGSAPCCCSRCTRWRWPASTQHSGYRGDPWGRLARTSHFLAVTTYGSAEDARREIDVVRAVHRRVIGTAPDGRPYAASDPHLLSWVHLAEVDSFLRAYQRYGAEPLTAAECDEYVAQSGRVATALGAVDVPGLGRRGASAMLRGLPSRAGRARRPPGRPPATSSPTRRCRVALRPAYLPIAGAAVGPAAALGPLAAAPAVAPRHRGHRRPRRRRARHPHDPLGPARRLTSLTLLAPAERERRSGERRRRPRPRTVAGMDRLVLASGSPRRRDLLAQLGLPFSVVRARRRRDAAARGAAARPRPPPGRRQGAGRRRRPGAGRRHDRRGRRRDPRQAGRRRRRPADAAPAVGPRPPRPHRRGAAGRRAGSTSRS